MTKKKKDNNYEIELEYIFREMCNRVGTDFDKLDMDEIEFQVWLYNYLVNNYAAFKAVQSLPYIDSDKIAKVVRNFCLFYGWALESDFEIDYDEEFGPLEEGTDTDLEENNP